jgi:hypothetical protein
MFTLQSSRCTIVDEQVQSTFVWSHSLLPVGSIELIYHIDSTNPLKLASVPLHLQLKSLNSNTTLFTIDTYLEFDSSRDFYFVDIRKHIHSADNQSLIIESSIKDETCQTSQTYLIVSSLSKPSQLNQTRKLNPTLSFDLRQFVQTRSETSSSTCQLQTIQIEFEQLGLAYLIIRPKQYLFTYCDGSCSLLNMSEQSSSSSSSSIHALMQSMAKKAYPRLPQPNCAPSSFADDHFLLRQNDGSIEISPIRDIIVKQCACL